MKFNFIEVSVKIKKYCLSGSGLDLLEKGLMSFNKNKLPVIVGKRIFLPEFQVLNDF